MRCQLDGGGYGLVASFKSPRRDEEESPKGLVREGVVFEQWQSFTL